ncbi:MAG: leucine-rich repeat domain-containing protein [Deltaproteobacteria bacterium]
MENGPRALVWGALFLGMGLGCEDPKPAPTPSGAPSPAAVAEKASAEKAALEKAALAKAAAETAAAAQAEEKKPVVCPKPPQVAFSDPVLEAEVRRKAGKADGELTLADLKKVRSVDLTRGGKPVDALDPCAFPLLTNLHQVYLGGGTLSDLSPLAGLTQLEGLRASMNQVGVITPLAGMLQMDRLDLGRTQVRDLTALKRMTKLTELMLDDTPVEDLSPVASLSNLERLSIKRTRVSDLSALKGLRKLKFLYVGGSPAAENAGGLKRPGLKISAED